MTRKTLKVLTATELARACGVSTSPIARLEKLGIIRPVYARARLHLFREDDVFTALDHLNHKGHQ